MSHEDRTFERIGSETVYDGSFISLSVDRFRFADGEEAERAIVHHPGAVGVVCHDGKHVILVRQPREAVGDPDSLEIPAGKLEEGEDVLTSARRELAEEVGLAAERWEHLSSFHSSIGVMDEEVHVYLGTGLSEASAEADENERIEVVRWPLSDLDAALAATHDAKTIIGLLLLRDRL
ncbi:MAG: hydrolase [Solirubrobacteraceae bacterium]|nr:hydrolase [Solirubrobacteraceae bacterium]